MASDTCELLCLDLPRAEALRAERLDVRSAGRLATLYRALADPTRLEVALALRDGGELCVCDLAWILARAQNLVSHHLSVLRAQQLVEFRRDGKMALYSLTEGGQRLLDIVAVDASMEVARG